MLQGKINRRTNQKTGLRKYTKVLFFSVLLIIATVVGLSAFKLTEVTCKTQYGECSPVLYQKINMIKGRSYLSSVSLIKKLLSTEPSVGKYNLQYLFPFRIDIEIVEVEGKYAMSVSDSELATVLDGNGVIIGFEENPSLPILIVNDLPKDKGEKVSDEKLFALRILERLNRLYEIKSANHSEDGMMIELESDLSVIFPLKGDEDVLIGSLVLIYNDLTSPSGSKINTEGVNIGTIDLRFEHPILKPEKIISGEGE